MSREGQIMLMLLHQDSKVQDSKVHLIKIGDVIIAMNTRGILPGIVQEVEIFSKGWP